MGVGVGQKQASLSMEEARLRIWGGQCTDPQSDVTCPQLAWPTQTWCMTG